MDSFLSYRCVAKRQCFAPAALYRPFGEQAAGVRSLSQFQALQDGEKELAGLRELGLTDAEIQLWQSRDAPEITEKVKATGDTEMPENRKQLCFFYFPSWSVLFCVAGLEV